jgi:uncharacterized NAD(P)/FAD-binding protein YdhS
MKNSISIIGGGFAGTILARQLIERTSQVKIYLFNHSSEVAKGVAYDCNQNTALLNVIASKMSAFPDNNEHFLNWCLNHPTYKNDSKSMVANAFLPRKIYGEYLESIWEETKIRAQENECELTLSLSKENIRIDTIDDDSITFSFHKDSEIYQFLNLFH